MDERQRLAIISFRQIKSICTNWIKRGDILKVLVRPLNKGETFCCSLAVAKNVFKNTEVTLNFSYYGRNYGAFNNTFFATYLKNKVKGYVIAKMSIESGCENPILSFYVLKEKLFSKEQKRVFEEKYLPEFLQLYYERMSDKSIKFTHEFVMVELVDDKMILHKQKIK